MTFYHFGNCLALACVPYHFTYKYSGLSEYGALRKCIQACLIYTLTQLCKMLFLATFFPTSELDEDEGYLEEDLHKEEKFDFFTEFLRLTVGLVDLVGIYLALQRIAGKGQVKIMIAGVGWAFAELFLTRVIFLWVGARGIEFDWKYILKSFDANISLVHFITLSCLIWLWMRRDIPKSVIPVIIGLLVMSSYKTLILDTFVHSFGLGIWTALAYKAIVTLCIGLITLQLYVGITANDLY
uniref:BOS complex subunit TMEM147 n=1 Tax=Lepeophtheirus salmonis TaxID=72036 RepID=D3PG66_LEPSM|nr:Transmembrane protein 147 [Lepeophtheirus salmonis]